MENKQVEREIPFFQLIYKNLFLEIIIVILCTVLMLGYSFATDKAVYTVSQSALLRTSVSSGIGGGSSSSSNASHGIWHVPVVIKSITNAEAMAEMNRIYDEKYPTAKDGIVAGRIKVSYKENSLIFNISYTDLDQQKAKDKLSVVFEVAKEQLKKDIKADPGSVDLILTDGVDDDGSVRYYSIETHNNTVQNILIGVGIGVVIALAVVLIKYVTDHTVKSKEEFEGLTDVSVLSFIEKTAKKKK